MTVYVDAGLTDAGQRREMLNKPGRFQGEKRGFFCDSGKSVTIPQLAFDL
jgi:hypothetical protein